MKKRTFRGRPVALAVASAFGATLMVGLSSTAALAQEKIERIEITGSAIKRSISDETPLPVTIIEVKTLRETGVTSVEEAMTRITASQSSLGSNGAIGSGTGGKAVADLRALGSNKTLILLNGRRLASFGFDAASVDLNAIPLAVVERIEVLRDGASAIYGTDAIGGVINFITKSNFDKGELALEASQPQIQGGATRRFTLTKGVGNLNADGYNFWASYDAHTQEVVTALQRKFGETGVIPGKVNKTSGTTFPANWSQLSGLAGNPTRATGCNPPGSLPLAATTCRFDYTSQIDIVAPTNTDTLMGRGSFKLGSHVASLEALHTENMNSTRIAPDPITGNTMPTTSPFFPAAADPTQPISVNWRMMPGGKRANQNDSSMDRAVATLNGSLSKTWDYNAGLFWTQSKVAEKLTDGYISTPLIRAGLAAGTLNPFADPTPAQVALIQAAKIIGTSATGKGTTSGGDFRVSGEVFDLPGGKLGLSAGVEMRNEKYKSDTDDAIVTAALGLGRGVAHTAGNRDVKAITLEAVVPVHKMLEFQLAVRTDSYSDFGRTTNPKVGFKFRPVESFMIRGSKNRGFRAPTLDDLHGPQQVTFSGNAYDDPLLCPGGVVNAAAGGIATRDCGQQVQANIGGNPNLKPETSESHTYGFVLQPTKDLQFSIDYWNIELKSTIIAFPETAVMDGNLVNRIFRCNTLSAAVQATLDRCSGLFANSNAIGFIDTLTSNAGLVKTNGIDLTGSYAFNAGAIGRIALTYNGTRVNSYKYQNTPLDPLRENVGIYADANPVFRWQHGIGVNHQLNNFSTWVIVSNKSGYIDQNAGGEGNSVPSYTLVDLTTTYTGFKGFSLTAGIKNLFNQDPPFSNQASTFQVGYDPRYTNPIGRAYFLRGSYQF